MKLNIAIVLSFLLFIGSNLFSQDFSSQKSKKVTEENGQKFYIHEVVKGNTLYNISKTYGVPTVLIEQNNPQLAEGLKLGMMLKIPVVKEKTEDFIYHIVKKKETLFQIAKIYNVNMADIRSMNNMTSDTISEGEYLKIPSFYVNADVNNLNKVATEEKTPQKIDDQKYTLYQVQAKETLFTISKRYGISVDALMYLNDLSSTDIHENQTLLIPKKLLNKQQSIADDTSKYIQYKVQPKETLYGIARKYAVSVNDIEKCNELNGKQIQIGQILLIPRKLNATGYIRHKVTDRREKLSKIAHNYQVSVLELKQANPRVESKLKRGESLFIPLGFVETDFEQHASKDTSATVQDTPANISEDTNCGDNKEQQKIYKVALMLPLYLSEVDSLCLLDSLELLNHATDKPFKFLEFYEGAILAAKEMNEDGLDFEMHTYDIPRETEAAAQVLMDPELQQMDLMISLTYSGSFELISQFSKNHHIPLVNAISKRRKVAYDNPYVFKVVPNNKKLYEKASDYVLKNYPQANIILIRNNPYQLSNEFDLLKQNLQQGMPKTVKIANDQILYKVNSYKMKYENLPSNFEYIATEKLQESNPYFNYDEIKEHPADSIVFSNPLHIVTYSKDSLSGIVDASSLFRNNFVIALGQDEVFAIELFTKLNFVRDSFNYQVIGLPHWNNFNSLDVEYTQPLGLRIMNSKFVDYSKPEVKAFVHKFRTEYGIEPMSNRHAFLGYDVTRYFLTALKKYGTNFSDCLQYLQLQLLENQMNYDSIPEGGYENTFWNIIQQKDYQYQFVE